MANATFVATDNNFDTEVTKEAGLVIVDFWAEWCGPCRQLGPKLDEIATEHQGRVKVYKMNVDENPDTPSKFHVRGIPTVVFLKGGQLVHQVVGNQPKEVFVEAIQRLG
jgi:thioredoxin 1